VSGGGAQTPRRFCLLTLHQQQQQQQQQRQRSRPIGGEAASASNATSRPVSQQWRYARAFSARTVDAPALASDGDNGTYRDDAAAGQCYALGGAGRDAHRALLRRFNARGYPCRDENGSATTDAPHFTAPLPMLRLVLTDTEPRTGRGLGRERA
jgi:hypothetical protein